MIPDYVYYLEVNNEFLLEFVFSSAEEAIEFAEENEMENYEVVEWNIH
jgi:hypothetical protein